MRIIGHRATHLVAAAAGAALLAAACGSGTPGQTADEEQAADGEDGAVVVDFWQQKFTDQEDAWYKEKIAEFNDSQDEIEVKHQVVPADVWDQKMKAAQAANKAPDVFTLNYNKVPPYARLGQITPIGDLIDDEKWDDLQDNVREAVTVDGDEYAYPFLVEPSTVLYYRKDMFEAAGLDPEEPPTTWDELIDYGEQLTSGDVSGFTTAQVAVELGWSSWGLQWNGAGKLPISDDWTTPQASDPGFEAVLQFYQDLYQGGVMPKQAHAPYPDALPFGEGKVAMMANGSWAAGQILNDYPDLVDNVGVAPFPSIDGDMTKPTATLGGWTLAVDAKSEDEQAAADVISWLLADDPERVKDFFEASMYSKSSPRISVDDAIKADSGAAEVNPWAATIAEDVIPYAKPEPTYDWNVSLAMAEAIEKAIQGGDITAALAEADNKIQKVITDLDLPGQLS